MTGIWIVTEGFPYEGYEVLMAYSDKEAANQHALALANKKIRGDCRGEFEVMEIELRTSYEGL